jgi:hypothetical protein
VRILVARVRCKVGHCDRLLGELFVIPAPMGHRSPFILQNANSGDGKGRRPRLMAAVPADYAGDTDILVWCHDHRSYNGGSARLAFAELRPAVERFRVTGKPQTVRWRPRN